ncbi:hypothetical protein [Pyxidicoccus caerfyrddinensis]|uniref:hypothetical protein n=1 Tax=Pyxidicoccus caerfyrddinensis TaxID=2709663 RepID=UPI0013DC2C7F|nr:hypothetical protein [Pyxidicoccus caerfyrddinensis]
MKQKGPGSANAQFTRLYQKVKNASRKSISAAARSSAEGVHSAERQKSSSL